MDVVIHQLYASAPRPLPFAPSIAMRAFLCGLLLLAGRLGDLISRKGVFLAGLGVFTLASFLCGVAQSQEDAAQDETSSIPKTLQPPKGLE